MSERLLSARRSSDRLPVGRQGLSVKRRRNRRYAFIASGVLLLIVTGALMYGLGRSEVRITRVVVYGADQSLANIAMTAMQGKYFGLIPRDSTFFFPSSHIRTAIIDAHPDIAAISIFHSGLTGLSIKVDERVPVARWCGNSPETRFDLGNSELRSNLVSGSASSTPAADCYFFDASGFIYATTTVDAPLNPFIIYEPLILDEGQTFINKTLPHAERFPTVFDFARQLNTFGSPTDSIVFRDDEIDDYLKSGVRITYVLGNEQDAFTALTSARANLDLTDGSIEYIDLRFPGKVYLKRKK